jgi:hypothetical protein
MKTEIKKENDVWSWFVLNNSGEVVAGGYCRTQKDAINDASYFDKTLKKQ